MIFGPLAAFELAAISDYAAQCKCPILSLAAAEDMTQRKAEPIFCAFVSDLGAGDAPPRRLRPQRAEL